MIFYLLFSSSSVYGQQDSISDWQEQVLSLIDADSFSEASYGRLMEMLGDLELNRSDTIFPVRIRQNIILSSNACLNIREGYHNVTADKIADGKAYRGDMWNHTVRYKLQYGKEWAAGLALDKDAGEKFRHRFPSFDSYSGYLSYSPIPAATKQGRRFRLAKAIVGNYRLRLGSGLILNQSFSLGKNIQSDAFMTSGTAVSPHSSTDQYNRMQGAVADVRMGKVSVIPFVSYKLIDASVSEDTITSIPTDGYHRTIGETRKRNAASVFNTGLHISFAGNWYNIGANLLYTRFSHIFYRPIRAYNINYFRGQELLQGSIDYHARRFGFELRGETAFDQSLNLATVNQISHSIGEDWKAALSYRYFSRQYQQLYASTISESSSMQGEQGATLTLTGSPLPYWLMTLSADYFHFATVQYGFDQPFSGFDTRISAQYAKRNLDMRLTYRLKSKKDISHSLDAVVSYLFFDALKLKTQVRCKVFVPYYDKASEDKVFEDRGSEDRGSEDKAAAGSRAAVTSAVEAPKFGYAVAQAIAWQREGHPLSAELQGCWFNAPDYKTRLYLSEKNVLYGFSIPMLYGKGIRASCTASYHIGQHLVAELKYALYHYLDRDHISSGLQQIWGQNQYNLWLQLRVKL